VTHQPTAAAVSKSESVNRRLLSTSISVSRIPDHCSAVMMTDRYVDHSAKDDRPIAINALRPESNAKFKRCN